MTSKEVEKMKNEEVLEILLGNVDYKDYSSETMRLVNSCVSRLWEILERLEMLESNSDKVIKDSVKLINKNLELQKENEKLKKALDVFAKHLQIERGLQESWLQFRNGDDQSDDLELEEFKLLKDVLGNKI